MFAWQEAQATDWCAPVSGKALLLWSNDAGCHAFIVWQLVQSVEKPVCFGFGADTKSFWWQLTHCIDATDALVPVWHDEHGTVACAPASTNPVVAWSKVPVNAIAVIV